MTQVKRSVGGRPSVTRKMQRYSLLKALGGLLLILGLIAVLRGNDPFPGVRRAALRQRRQAETAPAQRDFRDPSDAESENASVESAEEHIAENSQTGGGGRIFTFELESLQDGGKGKVVIETKPSWAPIGVQHFHELMDADFYEQAKFFRVVPDFVVQFGLAADPANNNPESIKDDPVVQTNARGTLTYATSGPDTRSTQLFINTKSSGNAFLDKQGFSPIGEVISGMEFVDAIYAGYEQKPDQGKIRRQGNEYLDREFPLLSYISKAFSGKGSAENGGDNSEKNNSEEGNV